MADQDKESAQQRTCFVICPFGPVVSPGVV